MPPLFEGKLDEGQPHGMDYVVPEGGGDGEVLDQHVVGYLEDQFPIFPEVCVYFVVKSSLRRCVEEFHPFAVISARLRFWPEF